MRMTIDAESVTALRHKLTEAFGDAIAFMRIQPIEHARKMKVCICLTSSSVSGLMAVIMHDVQCAEFGRVTRF
jgi:hypothetical protein